jgi:hypothetical protein
MDTIKHYSQFPATGVSLRQMVQFGERPSIGMKFQSGHETNSLDTRADFVVAVKERYFVPLNSCLKSSRFDWRTECKSCRIFPMASMKCLRSKKSKTGMRSHLR